MRRTRRRRWLWWEKIVFMAAGYAASSLGHLPIKA